ncbi:25S rRNA (cytosine-C(5))-methyltransferase rcm1 [Grifola frondosa]|uniref:25S rRNA (Cytosine-C(5))-methyltransferase rcm1 n=1 Tax=Grifola frondosa TaxID=5627 RepID=A0A1C7M5Y8_GRIFR|nr:25S rRNA (cytosine-C(5))-methyltransferase rcm1 [Grifola frondosa]
MNFYFEAAKVLDKLDAKQGSIKGVIATVAEKDRKRTAALVIETLKYKPVLCDVIDATQLLKQEKKITTRNLALVLVHDLLLSGGIQASEGVVKQAILRHKTRLHSEFQRIKIKRGVKSTEDLAQTDDSRAALIPRYIRVNTNCWTIDEAVQAFISRGYTLTGPFEANGFRFSTGFAKDEHIPDLLAFHPSVRFVDDPLYQAGKIILQDKASCFPAHILAPPARNDSVVIDATAAPGNKTSHLCALMRNRGKVTLFDWSVDVCVLKPCSCQLFAFERDRKRFTTLKTMLSRAQCHNVEPVNSDFLTISPEDPIFSRATHILLDPSCSGSGIVNRLDHLLETEAQMDGEQDRLNKLAAFQLMMIRHAMKFPSVKRIVYSTCSIHATENEHVVRQALESEEALEGHFKLAPPKEVLPLWNRRGLQDEMVHPVDALSLVRCSPGEDATNGFFVSLFVRTDRAREGADIQTNKKRKQDVDEEKASGKTKRRKKKNNQLRCDTGTHISQ